MHSDGELVGCEQCAAGRGTSLLAEDMFYCMPARQRALQSGKEEYSRLAKLVTQYAVFWPHVGFSLRRQGGPPDIMTPSAATRLANMK